MTLQSKLFLITDEGTQMGVVATRMQAQRLADTDDKLHENGGGTAVEREQELLHRWGYGPGYKPFYLLLSSVRGGNPIHSAIDAYEFSSTLHFAFIKILANWDDLTSGDEVNVQSERESSFEVKGCETCNEAVTADHTC